MDQNFRVGEVFADRFEIEAVMAETALGTLALVKDSSCGEQRLVEFLAIECDDARCDEIRHIASDVRTIQHKSIAGLKDFEVVEGVSCVEMEPVVGETLDNHLAVRRGRGQILGLKVAYSFLAHICLGLELLHKKGYFYGSLRPTSIFVTNQGRIRVANFLCRALLSERGQNPIFEFAFCRARSSGGRRANGAIRCLFVGRAHG